MYSFLTNFFIGLFFLLLNMYADKGRHHRIAIAYVSFLEDTHKKVFFFSGLTTKSVGRVKPPDH